MSIVRQQAANDNGRAKLISEIAEVLRAALSTKMPGGFSFGDEESLLLAATNEMVRVVLATKLQLLADSFGEEVLIDGELHRRHQPGKARYFSLCGAMDLSRWTYRRVGQRNGPTAVPMELAAGLIERATPALAYALAQGCAKSPIRGVEQDLIASHRRPPSKSTMDRMARSLGTLVNHEVEQIEAQVRESEDVPPEAFGINLGLDRTSIPMEEFEKVQTRRGCESTTVVRYRMGFVGTVALTDANCETLWTRRYAVPAHEGAEGIVKRMVADLKHAMRKRPELNIGVVQDGAIDVWCYVLDALKADPELKAKGWRETVDRYHATQRLAAALDVLFPTDEHMRRAKLAEWNDAMDTHAYAIRDIDKWIRRETHARPWKTQAAISKAVAAYFFNARMFRYASLGKLGLHQASGVTEGACKSLIAARAKRSGQRWRKQGISAVLALRSLLNSDRLPAFWNIFQDQFHVECMNAA